MVKTRKVAEKIDICYTEERMITLNISIEKKKAEAIKRMKMLRLHENTIIEFKEDCTVNASEPPIGGLFWLNDEEKKAVANFEKKYDSIIYTAIRSFTEIGNMTAFLYVSDNEEEWVEDIQGIQEEEVLAYVVNFDAPDCSEIGYIGFRRTPAAGLLRTW